MSLARNDLVGLAGPALLARESDERLVALVHDGDENAFAAIVDRYRASLERVCRRTLSPARAEDALQQAFASAYVALSRGVQPAALRAWLTTIAHNAAINELRDRQPESLEVGRELGDDEVPHDIVTRRESLRSVMRAVVDLPSRQRQVIVRQEFGGDSQEQIAGELGLTIGAVRQLAHRARCSIRAAAAALTPAPLWQRSPWLSGPCEGTELVAGSALAVAAKTAVAILVVGVAGGAAELTAARALPPPAAATTATTVTAKSAPHRRAAARPAGAARVPASFGATARVTTGRASTAGRSHRDRPQAPTATRHRTAGVAPSSVAPAAQPAAATPPAGAPAVEPTPDPHGGDHGIAGSEPGPGHGDHKRHGGSGHGRGGTSSGAAAVSGPGSPDTAAIPAPAADIDHVAEVEDEPQPVPEMDEVKVESDSSRGRNGSTSSEPSSGRAARSG